MTWILLLFLCQVPLESPAIEDASFTLGDHYRRGRWYPFGFRLRAEKPWKGRVKVQMEKGALFSRVADLDTGEHDFHIPILVNPDEPELLVQVGDNQKAFRIPLPADRYQLLVLVPEEGGGGDSVAKHLDQLPGHDEPAWIRPGQLPTYLASLDSLDFIWVEPAAVSALGKSQVDLLLHWATIRGRLFSTPEGKKALLALAGRGDSLVEEVPGPMARLLPLHRLPSDPAFPVTSKEFIRLTDPVSLILILYMVGGVVLALVVRRVTRVSILALGSGLVTLACMMPGIAWPPENFPWRTAIVPAGEESFILEDHFFVKKNRDFAFSPGESLVLPRFQKNLRVAWEHKVFLKNLEGENRAWSAAEAGGRSLTLGAGKTLRNSFADLEDATFSLEGTSFLGYAADLPAGEVLTTSGAGPPPERALGRPLLDFMNSSTRWVRESWFMGRLADADLLAEPFPLEFSPRECFLIWFPPAD